mmetsp:Transcript_10419/g.13209  ORF Transcript_10419/g.13209 Transcript_10419/m.13209 type:complete len:323 (+) Transcript_10419:115-1083(+)
MKLSIISACTVVAVKAAVVEGFLGGGYCRVSLTNNEVVLSSVPAAFRPSYRHDGKLFLSDIPNTDTEDLRETDPIKFLSLQTSALDVNAIVNAGVLMAVTILVLNQVATVDAGIMRGWTTEEMAVRIPVDNWLSYSSVLNAAPVFTKAVTSATVYTIGDLISQATDGRSIGEYDRGRVLRSLLAGLLAHGPMSHVWYDVSEQLFENVLHLSSGIGGTAVKVAIDQTFWGPLWNNTYILLLGLMKFDKLENIWGEMKRTTIPLLMSGLKLWPLAHCVTYGLIPVENRLLWVDLVEIIWVVILSTAADGGGDHGAPAPAVEEEK